MKKLFKELKKTHTCERCGAGLNLTIHHDQPQKHQKNNSIKNLKVLCLKCHQELHGISEKRKEKTKERCMKCYKPKETIYEISEKRLCTRCIRKKYGIPKNKKIEDWIKENENNKI